MKLEVRFLRLVVAVSDYGSLTRAGQHLNLTQSALSHQLSDLEALLGLRLFERAGKKMRATTAGERLVSRARPVLDQLREIEREVHDVASGREAVLRIATQCYTCYHWLPAVLANFSAQFPKVEVEIVPNATSRPLAALLAGKLDLCIVDRSVRDRRVRTTLLFGDDLMVVMSPDHPLASKAYIEAEDFAGEHLFLYSTPEDSYVFEHILNPAGVVPKAVSQVQLTEAMIELTKAGLGISVMARWAVEPHVRARTLRTVRLTKNGVAREWYAATRSLKAMPVYLREFERFLARAITAPPDLVAETEALARRRRAISHD